MPWHCHKEGKHDENPPVLVQATTCSGADLMQLKKRPITRAKAKKFKENLVRFIQGVIKSQ